MITERVDCLKNELQTTNIFSRSVQSPKVKIDQNSSKIANLTNINSQLLTNQSTNPSIQYIINIDPLQQMKDLVKPFYGNPEEDAMKWIDDINHFFDVIRLPGNKDELALFPTTFL